MQQYTVKRGKHIECQQRADEAWAFMYQTVQLGRRLIVDATMTPGGVKVDKRLRGVGANR